MSDTNLHFQPEWTGPATTLRHTWAPIANIDQFRWLSRADVLRHLTLARDELGVRHVRAVAMYSPEMSVWDYSLKDWRIPSAQKQRYANWQLIDLTLEGLLELGLKPIYTTCFTPLATTDAPETCWPDRNPIGMPRDLSQWAEFVSAGVRHHIERFGRTEVRSWYFECWNEPNLRNSFFAGDQADFFRLWSATWRAIKSVDPELQFGGPSTARGEWIPAFLDFTTRDGTPPDYLISHLYNNDSCAEPSSPFDGPASTRVKDSPHFSGGVIRGVRKELDRRGFTGEIHWNEWGRSWFPFDPLKETLIEPAFIGKLMTEVSQEADYFAFWCLSDIYNQAGFQSSEFQGNYGMLSLHGLRKPAWLAHQLLNRLGDRRVAVTGGDELHGALPTHTPQGTATLVYAYPATLADPPATREVRITLPASATRATLVRLGTAENNIFTAWRALGAPDYPTPEQLSALRADNTLVAAPEGAVRLERSADGLLEAVFTLECPGLALLTSCPA